MTIRKQTTHTALITIADLAKALRELGAELPGDVQDLRVRGVNQRTGTTFSAKNVTRLELTWTVTDEERSTEVSRGA